MLVVDSLTNAALTERLRADIRRVTDKPIRFLVAGHGEPGTLADVRAQRAHLDHQFQHGRDCFARGLSYYSALQVLAGDDMPSDSQRLILLASYWEFTGTRSGISGKTTQQNPAKGA